MLHGLASWQRSWPQSWLCGKGAELELGGPSRGGDLASIGIKLGKETRPKGEGDTPFSFQVLYACPHMYFDVFQFFLSSAFDKNDVRSGAFQFLQLPRSNGGRWGTRYSSADASLAERLAR